MDGMSAVTYHRLAMPFAMIRHFGQLDVHFAITQPDIEKVNAKDYDAIVISRFLRYNTKLLVECKKHGTKLIVDNDDFWSIPKHNPAYKMYRKHAKDAVINAIKHATRVITTTPQLAEKTKELNPNVYVCPNALDLEEPQWNAKAAHPFTIGYVTGSSHLYDVKLLENQLSNVLKRNQCNFLLAGYAPMERISQMMEYYITGEKERPTWFYIGEGVNVLNYGKYYAFMDAVIAPLEKTSFNKYKSELKIIEAAAYRLPIFVSAVEPYTNHRNNKGVIFVENNDWSILDKYLSDKALLKELGEANYQYCLKHHNLYQVNEQRIKAVTD
jgi:hypothetical protein